VRVDRTSDADEDQHDRSVDQCPKSIHEAGAYRGLNTPPSGETLRTTVGTLREGFPAETARCHRSIFGTAIVRESPVTGCRLATPSAVDRLALTDGRGLWRRTTTCAKISRRPYASLTWARSVRRNRPCCGGAVRTDFFAWCRRRLAALTRGLRCRSSVRHRPLRKGEDEEEEPEDQPAQFVHSPEDDQVVGTEESDRHSVHQGVQVIVGNDLKATVTTSGVSGTRIQALE